MRSQTLVLIGLAVLSLPVLSYSQETAALRTVRTMPLPAEVKGPFDHLAIDRRNNRLFVTPEDFKSVLVIDLQTGALIHRITGITRPHAVLYRDDLNRLYVTDGGGALKIFDGADYRLLTTVPLAKDADSLGYDPSRKLLYIASGGKDEGQTFSLLSIVDTSAGKKLTDIKIEGDTLEAMALDQFRPRLYLNNKAKNQIEVVDRWKGVVVASWPVTLCHENVAMALDEPHQRLFVGCRSGKMAIFDTNTGKELQALPITGNVDDLSYDAGTKRIYAAGNGVVSVLQQTSADQYRALGDVASGPQGKTGLLVPSLNRYFVSSPQHGNSNASIVEMESLGVPPYKASDPVISVKLEAPVAENLLLATMSKHPYLRKMGLHGTPTGEKESVIVANALASRIGVKTSASDFEAVKDGKTSCPAREDGSYYNAKMPMFDAAGRRIGILVMEIPFTSVVDQADAIRQAEDLRKELASQIPSWESLFK